MMEASAPPDVRRTSSARTRAPRRICGSPDLPRQLGEKSLQHVEIGRLAEVRLEAGFAGSSLIVGLGVAAERDPECGRERGVLPQQAGDRVAIERAREPD